MASEALLEKVRLLPLIEKIPVPVVPGEMTPSTVPEENERLPVPPRVAPFDTENE